MAEDAELAQARLLLGAMYDHVVEVSQKLEVEESRGHRSSIRGATLDRRHRSALRQDLYEAHRLIGALIRRYPDALDGEARLDVTAEGPAELTRHLRP